MLTKGNPATNSALQSSQSSIASPCPSSLLFTRQRFLKRVYLDVAKPKSGAPHCFLLVKYLLTSENTLSEVVEDKIPWGINRQLQLL